MNKTSITWGLIYKSFQKFPINKRKIVFESFLGRSYNDNPKAISDFILDQAYDYDIIWSVNNPKKIDSEEFEVVKKPSIVYLFHLATAQYVITNSRMPKGFEKRPGQKLIQTWHGTPLKRLVLDMEENHFPNTSKISYFINFLKDVEKWDYLISPNEYSTEIFKRAFAYEGKVLEIGYPRNDRLYTYHPEEQNAIREKLGIKPGAKVLLYTPTFRENNAKKKGQYIEQIKLNFNQVLKNNPDWVVLIRSHYLITEHQKIKNDNIIDVSGYDDINDLYIASDTLLTDYSSTMFDYAILNRPLIKYAHDYKEYEGKLRGFYLDYHNDIPATNIQNEVELSELLVNFDQYKEFWATEIMEFNQKFNSPSQGDSARKFVEFLENEMQ